MFKNINKDVMVASSVSGSGLSNSVSEKNRLDMEDPTFKQVRTALLKDEQNEATIEELSVSARDGLGFSDKTFGLNEFLTRPTFLQTVTWTSTAAPGSLVTSINPLEMIYNNGIMQDKLTNMRFLNTDFEVTVKVNPQPFEMGMLMVSAVPKSQNSGVSLSLASVFPHMLINITANNNITMKLPFVNDNEAFDLVNIVANRGWEIVLYVVSPLRSAVAPSTLNIEIWASLVNPRVSVPIAQSGDSDLKQTNEEGVVTKISGAVADTLEKVGTTLEKLPFVGTFIPPLTWLARVTNKVSSYYGWSKPINVRSVSLISPGGALRACHGEGQDNSVALSMSPDNGVDNTKSLFTDVDEMDLGYLLERKVLVDRVEVAVNDDKFFMNMPTDLAITNLPQTFVISNFLWSRYVTKFEIHIVKTKFHVGRLLIQWNIVAAPNRNTAVTNMNAVYSKVVDISTSNVFTFTVPWMDARPYNDKIQPGYLTISAFTPIQAPDTVTQNIDLVIYKSFTDFEGGFPYREAQAGCCSNFEPIVSDDLIPYTPMSFAASCQGESVSSLRFLAKRFSLCDRLNVTGSKVVFENAAQISRSVFGAINRYYTYRSGGIRYKIIFPPRLNIKATLSAESLEQFSNPAQWFFGHLTNVAEITVPFYSPVRRSGALYPWLKLQIELFDEKLIPLPLSEETALFVYVAAGDDYSASIPVPLRDT